MTEEGSVHRPARRLTAAGSEVLDEIVAQEVAVALVYNGISHAVMMATPCDLEDFARGFSLTEHIVEGPSEIYDIEVEPVGRGIEVRLTIAAKRMAGLQQRRRTLAGRTGCGLCGVDSLDAAMRPVPATSQATATVSRAAIARAMAALPAEQRINRENGATHAAGWATARRHAAGRARGCRPAQRARQAGRRARPLGRRRPGRLRGGHQPLLLRDGAQGGGHRRGGDRRRCRRRHRSPSRRPSRPGIALAAFVRDGRLTVYAHAERIAS